MFLQSDKVYVLNSSAISSIQLDFTVSQNGYISFKTIETWYKLANSKDYFNIEEHFKNEIQDEFVAKSNFTHSDLSRLVVTNIEKQDSVMIDLKLMNLFGGLHNHKASLTVGHLNAVPKAVLKSDGIETMFLGMRN